MDVSLLIPLNNQLFQYIQNFKNYNKLIINYKSQNNQGDFKILLNKYRNTRTLGRWWMRFRHTGIEQLNQYAYATELYEMIDSFIKTFNTIINVSLNTNIDNEQLQNIAYIRGFYQILLGESSINESTIEEIKRKTHLNSASLVIQTHFIDIPFKISNTLSKLKKTTILSNILRKEQKNVIKFILGDPASKIEHFQIGYKKLREKFLHHPRSYIFSFSPLHYGKENQIQKKPRLKQKLVAIHKTKRSEAHKTNHSALFKAVTINPKRTQTKITSKKNKEMGEIDLSQVIEKEIQSDEFKKYVTTLISRNEENFRLTIAC